MFGINACDVDTITVMGNAVNDCICQRTVITAELIIPFLKFILGVLWSSIFVTLMANKIGGLQFGIYRNCQISSRVFHNAVAALPLTKANRSDFE